MDLIYADDVGVDVGVLSDYTFDLAIGGDENDFELVVDMGSHVCREGYFLYIEGTEYGGIVDTIGVKTAGRKIVYKGRTWHGVLASKIIEPDKGKGHLVLSGEANAVLAFLIDRMGLSGMFVASEEQSDIIITGFQMDRYINGYAGMVKMLASADGRLVISFSNGKVLLRAGHIVDYSEDEQFDSDQVEMDIEKGYRPINHVVCLGKGELEAREVVHVYADEKGDVGQEQKIFGIYEVSKVYDNANAGSYEELEQRGIDIIKKSYASANKVSVGFSNDDMGYDIRDIVGAKEHVTGIEVTEKITKKIVSIARGKIDIKYKVGE